MFARILIVTSHTLDSTEWTAQFAATFESLGHAVRVCAIENSEDDAALVDAACEAFRPTVMIWDEEALACEQGKLLANRTERPCLRAALVRNPESIGPCGFLDFTIRLRSGSAWGLNAAGAGASAPVFDFPICVGQAYASATTSEPKNDRRFISVDQACTRDRHEALREACETARLDAMAFDPSWPESVDRATPGATHAFWRRKARYHVILEDGAGALQTDIAMRIAEGALILAPRSCALSKQLSLIPQSVVFFDEGGLANTIAELEANPEAFRAAASRQRNALDTLPDAERAAENLLETMDSHFSDLEKRMLSQEKPALHIVMYGWYGARNFGDDLLLTSTVDRIRGRYPHAVFHVVGANARVIERDYGFEAATPDRKDLIREFLKKAACAVFCGGLIFDDPLSQTAGEIEFCMSPWIEPTGQAAVCLLARSYGVPSVYLGFGAGPIENEATKASVRLIALSDALFLPRDVHAAQLIKACGVSDRQIQLRADLVLGARSYLEKHARSAEAAPREPFFTVSLREWHRNPAEFPQTIARALDVFTERSGLKALLLPFDEEDATLHACVLSHMRNKNNAILLEHRPTEQEILSCLNASQFAFAMRLHCSIIHHVLGKPAVGLNYNDKIEAHFRRFGQQELLMELDATSDAMIRSLSAAHEQARSASFASLGLDEAALLVNQAFDDLFAAIDGFRPRKEGRVVFFPRRISNAESWLTRRTHDLEQQNERLAGEAARLAQERDALKQETEALRASKSYRIGNLFMKPLHALLKKPGKPAEAENKAKPS